MTLPPPTWAPWSGCSEQGIGLGPTMAAFVVERGNIAGMVGPHPACPRASFFIWLTDPDGGHRGTGHWPGDCRPGAAAMHGPASAGRTRRCRPTRCYDVLVWSGQGLPFAGSLVLAGLEEHTGRELARIERVDGGGAWRILLAVQYPLTQDDIPGLCCCRSLGLGVLTQAYLVTGE